METVMRCPDCSARMELDDRWIPAVWKCSNFNCGIEIEDGGSWKKTHRDTLNVEEFEEEEPERHGDSYGDR